MEGGACGSETGRAGRRRRRRWCVSGGGIGMVWCCEVGVDGVVVGGVVGGGGVVEEVVVVEVDG
eukprot:1812950-Alexandrium_andersonii.AAC.1